jgi:hypothetical protein
MNPEVAALRAVADVEVRTIHTSRMEVEVAAVLIRCMLAHWAVNPRHAATLVLTHNRFLVFVVQVLGKVGEQLLELIVIKVAVAAYRQQKLNC